jgi:hypothetical protein
VRSSLHSVSEQPTYNSRHSSAEVCVSVHQGEASYVRPLGLWSSDVQVLVRTAPHRTERRRLRSDTVFARYLHASIAIQTGAAAVVPGIAPWAWDPPTMARRGGSREHRQGPGHIKPPP